MLDLPPWYSLSSTKELTAFISGTHSRLGKGTLPFELSEHGTDFLKLIASYILQPCACFYAATIDGSLCTVEVSVPSRNPSVGCISEVCSYTLVSPLESTD